ncbi:MAG: cbb3-type cytochrome c oxidase subunit I, partial [Pseudomonadota bacterium]
WRHPEVSILTRPFVGILSVIVPTFSWKRLFGFTALVYATAVFMILSYIVWLHHFFTMGAGADVNSFFGITTMIISIPTGAKIFNWLFTMYKGRIQFELPMMWTIAFLLTFVVGGMTGVLLAIPPADYVLHNSLFLVAHFHNVIIGGVVFGIFAGINYWWPKAFGFKLDRTWGLVSFWGWVVGFYFAFMPLYLLGLMGVTRRLSQFEDTIYAGYFFTAAIGVALIAVGVMAFFVQIYVSIKNRDTLACDGDPWDARTLEWSTSSPPPYYNFAFTPRVYRRDAWEHMKSAGYERKTDGYAPIHMPHYTATGIVISGLWTAMGFALIWHIWWLALATGMASLVYGIAHTFNYNRDYYVTVDEVADIEGTRTKQEAAYNNVAAAQ